MSPTPIVASSRRLVSSPRLVPVVGSSSRSACRSVLRPAVVPSHPSSRLVVPCRRGRRFRLLAAIYLRPVCRFVFRFAVVPPSVSLSSYPGSRLVCCPSVPSAVVPVSRLIRRPVSAVISSAAHCRLVRRSVLLVARRSSSRSVLVPSSSRSSSRSPSFRSSSRPFVSSFIVGSSALPVPSTRWAGRFSHSIASVASKQAREQAGGRRAMD